jgi:hypothetical protein
MFVVVRDGIPQNFKHILCSGCSCTASGKQETLAVQLLANEEKS